MSIIVCEVCDKTVDSDYEEIHTDYINYEPQVYTMCDDCYKQKEE